MTPSIDSFEEKSLSGRNRRLLYEWKRISERTANRTDICYQVTRRNPLGLPTGYLVTYHIKSICGVEDVQELENKEVGNPPVFASRFLMQIDIPSNYPCIDAPPAFHFLSKDESGNDIPHPWHPNIRFFGDFCGRVCLNMPDTYTDLIWGIERVALYLRYDLYHAIAEPPYPEDLKVAEWVIAQGEPNEWIYFEQK